MRYGKRTTELLNAPLYMKKDANRMRKRISHFNVKVDLPAQGDHARLGGHRLELGRVHVLGACDVSWNKE